MTSQLHQSTVLVLNRNWQAIAVRTPAEAFGLLATGAARGLDIAEGRIEPVPWSDWLNLPVRPHDAGIGTPRGTVRVPTVVLLGRYAKVPVRQVAFSPRAIWVRDGGRCQYTGRPLAPHEGNIDHVVPRSRGGTTSWENCVLADRRINTRKGNRLPHEAGLTLLRPPEKPRAVAVTALLRNPQAVADWALFLNPP
jgi:5-methylcytosine-specific restriction endonuclease McrA